VILGMCFLTFCTGSLLVGKFALGLGIGQLQTLTAVTLIIGGEAILYSVRERRHLWKSMPSTWMIVASVADVGIIASLALRGVGVHELSVAVVGGVLVASVLFGVALDFVKVPVFRRLGIS